MARKNLLTTAEKAQIVKLLSQGSTSLEISKKIGRDHRTVKAYIENPSKEYVRPKGPYKKSVTSREKTLLKRSMAKGPLRSSKDIFEDAGVNKLGKSARCQLLKTIGKVKTANKKPHLTQKHKQQRLTWARESLNPCEHYWSLLKKRVYAAGKQYNSIGELWQGVTEAAADITSEEIRTLTESMDRKLEQ
ncbi:hypothetical protein FOZ62_027679, partial [Perkinsus olseni]